MNCPQCQERLDEQLDELRPGLRNGTLSSDDARTQAQTALAEAVSHCADCEVELRAHLNMRLSLMLPDAQISSVAVPPALRANVRRALERESTTPTYAKLGWNPLKGFAWTGSIVLSAIALFVVARPFLIEKSVAPLSEMAVPPAPATSDSDTGGAASPQGRIRQAPGASRPVPPRITAGRRPAPKMGGAQPPVGSTPAPLTTPAPGTDASPGFVDPVRPADPAAPSPDVSAPPSAMSRPPGNAKNSEAPNKRPRNNDNDSSAPTETQRPSGALSAPRPPMPMVGSSAPVKNPTPLAKVGPRPPAAPRPGVQPPAPSTSNALGLTVRFVPVAAALNSAPMRSNLYTAPKGPPSAAVAPPPAPVVPAPVAPSKVAPDGAQDAGRGAEGTRTMRSRAIPDNQTRGAAESRTDNGDSESMAAANADAVEVEKGTLSLSVNEEVTNARVVGQVKGRTGDGVVLWSGTAPARKPISVPLEPLKATKGDTVNVSFQQQVSPSETKTLATTSVTIP